MKLTKEEQRQALTKALREMARISDARVVDPGHRDWANLAMAQITLVLESL